MHTMIDQAKKILKTVFGYAGFIFLQEDVIENILRKNDTLVMDSKCTNQSQARI